MTKADRNGRVGLFVGAIGCAALITAVIAYPISATIARKVADDSAAEFERRVSENTAAAAAAKEKAAEALTILKETAPADVLANQQARFDDVLANQQDQFAALMAEIESAKDEFVAVVDSMKQQADDRFRGADMDRWLDQERERTGEPITPWRK